MIERDFGYPDRQSCERRSRKTRASAARHRQVRFELLESRTLLAPLVNAGTASDVVFNLPAGPNTVIFEDDGVASNGISQLRSTNGTFDTTTFANPTGSLTINRGNAGDSLTITSIPDFTADLKIGSWISPFNSVSFAGAITLAAARNVSAFATSQSVAPGVTVAVSGSGSIALTADNVELNATAALNAGTSAVTIAPLSSGRPVNLGTEIATQLSLTDAELDRVVAATLRIGDSVFGGPITISAPINVANNATPIPTLHLLSNGAVVNSVANGPAVTATNLAVEGFSGSGNATTLTTQVSNLAASYVGGYDLQISNIGALTAKSVDGVTRVGATGGGMTLVTSGPLTISASTGSNPGPTRITAAVQDQLLTINSFVSGLGDATLTADKMSIQTIVNFGSSKVTLLPESAATSGDAINLGSASDTSAGTLELSSADIFNIAAGTIQIGDANSGPITISGNVSLRNKINLSLKSGGAINFTSGSLNTVGGNLALTPGSAPTIGVAKMGTDVNLSSSGTLSFAAGSNLAIAINGTTVDTQYHQLNVIGKVDLTGAGLVLSGNYSPAIGDAFVIVNNDGNADPVVGTFNGLPEGGVFSVTNGALVGTFQISYHGGDGNDVVLTEVNAAPTFVKGTDQNSTDESGPLAISNWAIGIVAGLPGEAGQQLHFVMQANTNPSLFAVGPAIFADGTLTYTPAPNASGTAQITFVLVDDGGTANGGSDTSLPQTFAINVTKPHPWHNTLHSIDVTGAGNQPDGVVVAGDALAIINYINAFGAGAIPANATPAPPYLDTTGGANGTGDNSVVAADALAVINYLNAFGPGLPGPAGEGEGPFQPTLSGTLTETDMLNLLAIDVAMQPKRRW